AGTLSAAEIEVEVVGQEKPESLRINGLEGLAFKPSESSKYPAAVAKKTFGNIKLGGNLTVTMPAADDFARVERRVKPRSVENLLEKKEVAGETYFLISGVITTDVQTNRPPLAHIGII